MNAKLCESGLCERGLCERKLCEREWRDCGKRYVGRGQWGRAGRDEYEKRGQHVVGVGRNEAHVSGDAACLPTISSMSFSFRM